MAFLTPEELNTHIYDDVRDAISESDNAKVAAAIRASIAEAEGYMSRYDTEAILAKAGDERDPILLMYLKDIAVWHFLVLANPGVDLELRENRYKSAVGWLTKVQGGKVVPKGWPLNEPAEKQSYFQYGSNPRRNSQY